MYKVTYRFIFPKYSIPGYFRAKQFRWKNVLLLSVGLAGRH